ncbi:nuclear transport factor 2 family protein [Nocardia stercoris]|uniref:Nuclear transport factor 2 family protein n=1 Tax=Nocardia stercoris TaxID=2483361 RepID=A0A3M2L3T3_9NOCA|nr:nuclear transport factor 2 family protein [Nocardia stercoris]RMI31370.1 nuclear transport factor 2 family protein [Nocardia stercoris]
MLDITTADRLAIHEIIALHGHLADDRAWDRLAEVFAEDVIFDLEDFGYGTLRGLAALRALAEGSQDDEGQPLGHHVTNIVVVGAHGDQAQTRAKALAVNADGTTGTAVYEDRLRRADQGWRIYYRRVVARRKP